MSKSDRFSQELDLPKGIEGGSVKISKFRYSLVGLLAAFAYPAPDALAGWSDYLPDCSSVGRYLGSSAGDYCRNGVSSVEQHAESLRQELVDTYESTKDSVSHRTAPILDAGSTAAGALRREATEKLRAASTYAEERARCEGLPCGVLTGIPDAARTEVHGLLLSLSQAASSPRCEELAQEMGIAYKAQPSWPSIDLSGYGQRHPVGCQSDYQSALGQAFESAIVMPVGCSWSGMKGFAVDGAWGDVEFLGSAVSFVADSAVFLASLTDDILAQPFIDMAQMSGLTDDSTINSYGYRSSHQRSCDIQTKVNSGLKATYEIFKHFHDQCGRDPACMDRRLRGFRFSVCRQVDPYFLIASDAKASGQILKIVLEGLPALDAQAAAAISGMKCSEIVDKACRVAGMIGWELGGDAVATSVAAVLGVGVGGATTFGVTLSKSVLKFATRHVDEFTAFLTKGLPRLIEQLAALAKIPTDDIIKALLVQLEAGEEGKKWAKPLRDALAAAGLRVPEIPASVNPGAVQVDGATGLVARSADEVVDDLFLNPPEEVAYWPARATYFGAPYRKTGSSRGRNPGGAWTSIGRREDIATHGSGADPFSEPFHFINFPGSSSSFSVFGAKPQRSFLGDSAEAFGLRVDGEVFQFANHTELNGNAARLNASLPEDQKLIVKFIDPDSGNGFLDDRSGLVTFSERLEWPMSSKGEFFMHDVTTHNAINLMPPKVLRHFQSQIKTVMTLVRKLEASGQKVLAGEVVEASMRYLDNMMGLPSFHGAGLQGSSMQPVFGGGAEGILSLLQKGGIEDLRMLEKIELVLSKSRSGMPRGMPDYSQAELGRDMESRKNLISGLWRQIQ